MAKEVKRIASLIDGRVCPWYSVEDPIPEKFVVVPPDLYEKYVAGKIKDGRELAKQALMRDGSEVGTAKQNVAAPQPAKPTVPPDEVDPESIPQGEPTSPEVTHFPNGGTMRA